MHRKLLWLLLTTLAAVFALERSETLIPAQLRVENVMKSYPKIKEFLTKLPKHESKPAILIERKWVRDSKVSKAERDERDERYRHKLLFLVQATGPLVKFRYIYVIFALLLSIGFLAFSISGVLKSSTVVVVRNLFDERKPPRDLPATLSLHLRSKAAEKTSIVTLAPTETKVAAAAAAGTSTTTTTNKE